jgi:hypothetical protein
LVPYDPVYKGFVPDLILKGNNSIRFHILGYLAAGHTAGEMMAEFPDLRKEQRAACLDYARALSEFEVAA